MDILPWSFLPIWCLSCADWFEDLLWRSFFCHFGICRQIILEVISLSDSKIACFFINFIFPLLFFFKHKVCSMLSCVFLYRIRLVLSCYWIFPAPITESKSVISLAYSFSIVRLLNCCIYIYVLHMLLKCHRLASITYIIIIANNVYLLSYFLFWMLLVRYCFLIYL